MRNLRQSLSKTTENEGPINTSTSQPLNRNAARKSKFASPQPLNPSTPQQLDTSTPQPSRPSLLPPPQSDHSTLQPLNLSISRPSRASLLPMTQADLLSPQPLNPSSTRPSKISRVSRLAPPDSSIENRPSNLNLNPTKLTKRAEIESSGLLDAFGRALRDLHHISTSIPRRPLNTSTAQHLNPSTPQQLNTSTAQPLNVFEVVARSLLRQDNSLRLIKQKKNSYIGNGYHGKLPPVYPSIKTFR